MTKRGLEELKKIVEKNPKILDSLHPLERLVVTKLCKGLDKKHSKGRAKALPSPN